MQDLFSALNAGVLPAVSYVKAPAYPDSHAGYSDPLDEQHFDVSVINALMQSSFWSRSAVIITQDDSDGWYDHVPGPIVIQSATPADVNGGVVSDGTPGRCGYGPRLPMLVISSFATTNHVSHVLTDQAAIVRFIEHNWFSGQRISPQSADDITDPLDDLFDFNQQLTRILLLDPATGQLLAAAPAAPAAGQAVTTATYQPGWNLVGAPAGTAFTQAMNPLYTFPVGATGRMPRSQIWCAGAAPPAGMKLLDTERFAE